MDEDERQNGKRLTNDRHTGIIEIVSTHHYCVAVKRRSVREKMTRQGESFIYEREITAYSGRCQRYL